MEKYSLGILILSVSPFTYSFLILTVAAGNFPIFVVMIPQESGIGASGSLNEN